MSYQNLLQFQILGNSGKDYLIVLAVFVGALFALKIFREVVLHRLKKAAEKTKTDLDDVLIETVHSIRPPFYLIVAVYVALRFLTLPNLAVEIIDGLFILALVFQAVRALQIFIDFWTKKVAGGAAVKNISVLIKIALWLLAFLIILSNWGFNVTSLIAGLGIGGIAIAFALQNILSDIFSSFSILIDKPFQVGDFIIAGKEKGTVEKIGIKTTRLRSMDGEELIIPNRDLTDARLHNYKRVERRRGSFVFGVTYDTPTEKLKKIPDWVKEIINSCELAEADRVHFKNYGDFSLNFEAVFYVNTADYVVFLDAQQKIFLNLKEKFEEEGIEFAYPTQTLFLKKQ